MKIYNLSPLPDIILLKHKKTLITQLILIGILIMSIFAFYQTENVKMKQENLIAPKKASVKNDLLSSLVYITNFLRDNKIKNFELTMNEKQIRLTFIDKPSVDVVEKIKAKFPKIMIEAANENI